MVIAMIGQKGIPSRSGGVERHVDFLSRGLASRGHRVIVFGRRWYVGNAQTPAGIEQVFVPSFRTKHLDAISHSVASLFAAWKFSPDIIHLHGTGIALVAPLARILHPKSKIIVTFHCMDRLFSKWGLIARLAFHIGEWMACKTAHKTITISQELARYCLDAYDTQTTFIPHALPMPEPVTNAESVLSKLGLNANGYFLFVGRLLPHKRAHILVDAYAKAREARPDMFADKPLVIVGGASWTDRYARWLCKMAAGIPGVHIVGEKHGRDLAALQANAYAHVFPTSNEGMSLAVIEACQYGRLVIATDIDANREATGGHFFAVPTLDTEVLATHLILACATPAFVRERVAKLAYQHVLKSHNQDDRVDDTLRFYQDAIDGRRDLVSMPSFATA